MDRELLKKAKTLAARGYQVQVQKEEGPNGTAIWVAYVPEMPSCVVQGDSPEHAKEALKTVREDYIYFRSDEVCLCQTRNRCRLTQR